ncbi:glycosyltransferase family 2 protein [Ligilactobacillus salivarius]|uniref:glycosyltransferase family 2 protein n=1 Tax=Ligilactobacillus salivarius TaxID=1624 RepID=UPI0009DB1C10|nr:glycosyltransferase family 2 protein [Ligilactobacillus salivarius]ATP35307.1 glycosyltransferase family 2 protein [Ligilactobacillus salivarius]MDO5004760.1 glycosyltransferase [Ligilactobacillus salivarius]OQR04356.1 N-acetylglucosaminyltransferase [Ligilactobacillus salivarius]OQR05489.1 N-acetylglucosaminyltransferase [Ligilactobacillus salivarius]
MEDYLITIVIPMYNVESSIERLIISISEAFKDQESLVEVLAIDDGSTDKTVEIFKNLHEKSQPLALKLIQNSHSGVSKARNTGIKYSKGRYITFVDSDDELALVDVVDLKEKLAQNAEVIIFDTDRNETIDLNKDGNRAKVLAEISMLGRHVISAGIQNKIYLRSFLIENKISFNDRLRVGEDTLFVFDAVSLANKVVETKGKFYVVHESSSVHLFNEYNLTNELFFRKYMLEILSRFETDPTIEKIKIRFGITGIIFLIECYFAPLVRTGRLTYTEAKVKLEDIVREGQYEGFDSNIFDKALSKRGKIFRRLINKGMFKTVIFLLNTEDRIKGINRI